MSYGRYFVVLVTVWYYRRQQERTLEKSGQGVEARASARVLVENRQEGKSHKVFVNEQWMFSRGRRIRGGIEKPARIRPHHKDTFCSFTNTR